MAVEDSLRAIRLAQIVFLLIDANAPLEKQDIQIAEHVVNEGRALILVVNKYDTIEDKKELLDTINMRLERSLNQIKDLTIVPISALHGKNINKLMKSAEHTYKIWNKRFSTGPLNRWLAAIESQHPAPLVQGRPNRLKYISQIKTRPPTFAIWVSRPKDLPASYKRYITNGLRDDFEIPGVPIRLLVRTSKNPYK
jgi:GTP-binding protein